MRKTLRVFLAFISLMIIGAVAICVWLMSASGLGFIQSQINSIEGVHVAEFGRMQGGGFVVEGVRLSDDEGEYALFKHIEITPSFISLLRGVVEVDAFYLKGAEWIRRPVLAEQDDVKTASGGVGALGYIRAVRVHDLQLRDVRVDKAVMGEAVSLEALGHVNINLKHILYSQVNLKIWDNDKLFAHAFIGDQRFEMNVDDAGLIARLAGVEEEKPIYILGAGVYEHDGHWRGRLEANVGGDISALFSVLYLGDDKFEVEGHVDVVGVTPEAVKFKGGADFKLAHGQMAAKMGEDIAVSAAIRRAGGRIGFRNLHVNYEGVQLGGRGWYDMYSGGVGANLKFGLADNILAYVPDISGVLGADIRVRGHVAPMNVSVDVQGGVQNFDTKYADLMAVVGKQPKLTAQAFVLEDGIRLQRLRLEGDRLLGKAGGYVHEFHVADIEYSLSAVLAGQKKGRLDVNGVLEGDIAAIGASGQIQAAYAPANISVHYDFLDNILKLSDLMGDVAGMAVKGGARIDVGAQNLEANIGLDDLGGMQVDFNIKGQDWTKLSVEAALGGDVVGEALVTFDAAASPIVFKAERLWAGFGGYDVRARAPFDVVYGVMSDDVGRDDAGRNDAGVRADEIVIKDASFDALGGRIDLNAKLFSNDLDGRADFVFTDFVLPSGNLRLNGQGRVLLSGGDVDAKGVIRQTGGEQIDVSVKTKISGGAALSGFAKGDLNFAVVHLLPMMDGHDVDGQLGLDVNFTGRNNAPLLNGQLTLKNGRYDNAVYGTKLRGIEAHILFDGQNFSLEGGRAHDEKGGTIAMSGKGDLAGERLEIDFMAHNLRAAATPKISLQVSGDGVFSMANSQGRLHGNMHIDKADIYVDDMFGNSNPYRGFVVIDSMQQAQSIDESAPIMFDVTIKGEQGIFVRGRGLESEWVVDLHVGGNANRPEAQGYLGVKSGRYEVADLMAVLKPKSRVNFVQGAVIDNPELDIEGEIKGSGHSAIITVRGTVERPVVNISSADGKPADEALAYVMFGEATDRLGPGQLVRIARVLAAFSGTGGGFDPLNDIRRNLGLDALSVGMDESGDASVSVGKYLGDGIYVSVEQGATPASTAVKTEIDLTRRIRVETKVTPDDNSVGVQWRYDY